MNIIDLEQGTDAWLDWRRTGIGSSDAPSILDVSPWKTRKQLWEEKVLEYHKDKKVFTNDQMAIIVKKMRARESKNDSAKNRGKKLEDPCREEYEKFMGFKVPPVCGTHKNLPFLKVSLDGYNQEKDLFVEIKAPNQKSHEVAIAGKVPDYYVPQLLHQFVVSEASRCHYISYHDKYPPGQSLVIVRVDKETARETLQNDNALEDQIEMMKEAMEHFWSLVLKAEYDIPEEE